MLTLLLVVTVPVQVQLLKEHIYSQPTAHLLLNIYIITSVTCFS